jgi:hypothetical protein
MGSILADVTPRVVATVLAQLADLHAWGRDARGQWWALLSWGVYGNLDTGGNGFVYCSAWVPSTQVHTSTDPTQVPLYRLVERFDLPPDPAAWPTPAGSRGRTWHHYGAVTARPPGPPGVTGLAGLPAPR